MTEDEAKAVAAVAALCLTWGGWRRWEPVMRYGRLFTPGTNTVSGRRGRSPDPGRKAWRLAMDSGLLYAEGYAGYVGDPRAGGVTMPWAWAWCLDGETVVDPAATRQGTAFFGVALRPEYMRLVYEAQRGDDGSEGFLWAFTRGDREIPPLDPNADIALDVGRDIPSPVREWALTAERHPGTARRPPDWVLAELLGDAGPGPAGQDPLRGLFVSTFGQQQAPGPATSGPYARFMVRWADWFSSGMALQCSGKAAGAFSDDGDIVGMIRDGDSVATVMRMADEHRPRCEWQASAAAEEAAGRPAWTPAEARLQSGGRTFAVLRRLDYKVWDAWLHPPAPGGAAAGVRVTRNGASYEMAFAAVFRAMGAAMPADFATVYAGEQPDPGSGPKGQDTEPAAAPLPMSYVRYLVRRAEWLSSGMSLNCSGRTGGVSSDDAAILEGEIREGDSLDTLIRMADEHRPQCYWALCPGDEREHPELTVEKRAEVHLTWRMGPRASKDFVVLHRLGHMAWDAWLHPLRMEGHKVIGEPPVLLTRKGVSYEIALAAAFRAMGDEMPEKFGVAYL